MRIISAEFLLQVGCARLALPCLALPCVAAVRKRCGADYRSLGYAAALIEAYTALVAFSAAVSGLGYTIVAALS
jgi:hypothetical protein